MLCCFYVFVGVSDAQQFRLITNITSFPVAVNASTYTLSVSLPSDQTGNNFLPTQIASDGSYRIFFQNERIYTVVDVQNATFSNADLTIEEYGDTDGAPSGQGIVYDPQGRESIPFSPVTNAGASPVLNAAIGTYNASIESETGASNDAIDITITDENDIINAENVEESLQEVVINQNIIDQRSSNTNLVIGVSDEDVDLGTFTGVTIPDQSTVKASLQILELTLEDLDLDDIAETATKKHFTLLEQTKLASIEEGAEANVQANWNEVDNAADAFISNKPATISIQQAADIDLNNAHRIATNNPHNVTATQINLGEVDNTSDLNKPISDATQAALDTKLSSVNLGINTTTNIVQITNDGGNGTAIIPYSNAFAGIMPRILEGNVDPNGVIVSESDLQLYRNTMTDTYYIAKGGASTVWVKLNNEGGNAAVLSVNNKTGIVVLDLDDIAETATNRHFSLADETKLNGIENGAEVNVNPDWNASTGAALIFNKPTTISAAQANNINTNTVHRNLTNNPHGVTAAQLGALTSVNLSATAGTFSFLINNSAGANVTIPPYTTNSSGIMPRLLEANGSPIGVLTPNAKGQIYRNTANDDLYYAIGITNTDWEKISGETSSGSGTSGRAVMWGAGGTQSNFPLESTGGRVRLTQATGLELNKSTSFTKPSPSTRAILTFDDDIDRVQVSANSVYNTLAYDSELTREVIILNSNSTYAPARSCFIYGDLTVNNSTKIIDVSDIKQGTQMTVFAFGSTITVDSSNGGFLNKIGQTASNTVTLTSEIRNYVWVGSTWIEN